MYHSEDSWASISTLLLVNTSLLKRWKYFPSCASRMAVRGWTNRIKSSILRFQMQVSRERQLLQLSLLSTEKTISLRKQLPNLMKRFPEELRFGQHLSNTQLMPKPIVIHVEASP